MLRRCIGRLGRCYAVARGEIHAASYYCCGHNRARHEEARHAVRRILRSDRRSCRPVRSLRRRYAQRVFQRLRERFEVVVPAARRHFVRVAMCQRAHRFRQRFLARHRGALHEHWDDEPLAGERGLDLQPDPVAGIVEPPLAARVASIEPPATDDYQHHRAFRHSFFDGEPELLARADRGDVHEHARFAEAPPQVREQMPGLSLRVVPAIADEDLAHARFRAPSAAAARFSR